MREPGFWWQAPGVASALLTPAAALYGAVSGARLRGAGHDCGVPVICVGNPTLGGAGKTPVAIAVARMLAEVGRRPFLLSRGYGGSAVGPLLVDPSRHDAGLVGDEPLLLARAAPTVVARDRVAGAALARAQGADVIVMDDGFQNPALRKSRSVLVVDAARGVGNGCVFPAGPLRAPLAPQLERAQALLLMGEGAAGDAVAAAAGGLVVLRARLAPDAATLEALRGRRVLAFAGIGDNAKFFATLRRAGVEVAETASFADHHRYRRAEALELVSRAERGGLALVTTEKDLVRLAGQADVAALAAVAVALPVSLELAEPDAFRAFVLG